MSYLYKGSNLLWHLLIKQRLTARVWRPLVEQSQRRHVRYRARLEQAGPAAPVRAATHMGAGV